MYGRRFRPICRMDEGVDQGMWSAQCRSELGNEERPDVERMVWELHHAHFAFRIGARHSHLPTTQLGDSRWIDAEVAVILFSRLEHSVDAGDARFRLQGNEELAPGQRALELRHEQVGSVWIVLGMLRVDEPEHVARIL